MQSIVSLALMASSIVLAAAVPTTPPPSTPQPFYLQAQLVGAPVNPQHKNFNNTYLSLYHTGAGFNDVVFTANKSEVAYINGTAFQIPINGGEQAFYLHLSYVDYVEWGPVSANVVAPSVASDGAYSFNAQKNLVSNSSLFGGWRLCNWSHGKTFPQLFVDFQGTEYLPASCEYVNLKPVYA